MPIRTWKEDTHRQVHPNIFIHAITCPYIPPLEQQGLAESEVNPSLPCPGGSSHHDHRQTRGSLMAVLLNSRSNTRGFQLRQKCTCFVTCIPRVMPATISHFLPWYFLPFPPVRRQVHCCCFCSTPRLVMEATCNQKIAFLETSFAFVFCMLIQYLPTYIPFIHIHIHLYLHFHFHIREMTGCDLRKESMAGREFLLPCQLVHHTQFFSHFPNVDCCILLSRLYRSIWLYGKIASMLKTTLESDDTLMINSTALYRVDSRMMGRVV
ncbi:hypothetical protein GGS26DRAFT_564637 [Hypomontagnella submonticulosa]|nr:hypothetical protein GGS26DRAFT_564637 [Hypomontagnella submonticulosa]